MRVTAKHRLAAMEHARIQVEKEPDASPIPEWAEKLTPAQAALVEGLLRAYPRVLDRYYLNEEVIPKADHAKERVDKIVDVYVLKVRRRLGQDVIETVHGRGFRCGKAFHALHTDHIANPRGLSPWL